MPIDTNNKDITNISKNKNLNKTKTDNFIKGLWDYYQGVYNEDNPILPVLKTQIFSEPLWRLKENTSQEELYPECDSMWTHFDNNFVIPEISSGWGRL